MKKIIPNGEWLTQISKQQEIEIENNTKFLNEQDILRIVVYGRIEAPNPSLRRQYCHFLVDIKSGQISEISERQLTTGDKDPTDIRIIIETNTDKNLTTLKIYDGDATRLLPQAKFVVLKSLENHNKELIKRAQEHQKKEPSAFIKYFQDSK